MNNVAEEMRHLPKLAKQEPKKRFNHLWALVTDQRWLMQAWEEIHSNQGAMTPGGDGLTAEDMDHERIQRLSERLKSGQYRPQPVRRIYIPKGNGKTRPLGIPGPEDKTVQQAIRMVLEPIFEADFHECSHGFRHNRSTHTALRDVARKFPRTTWTIEVDIEGCFDNIPHGKLMKEVARRIADEKVLGLIRAFLDAGYMEQQVYHQTYSGTPQGGILSPLLCNIFLHQLDEFMMKDLRANEPQSKRVGNARRNPEYRRIENKVTRLRRQLKQALGPKRDGIIKQLTELERQQRQTPVYAKDKRHPSKVGYDRYADDMVIQVQGKKTEALSYKDQIGKKLQEMELTLSEEKTKLTHWRNPVNFLGYQLHGTRTRKGTSLRPILNIPQKKVQGIKDALGVVSGYHHIPEADLIVQMSAMLRGWCNYYCYATNPQTTFSNLASHTWWQYAHYGARKHRLSTRQFANRARRTGELATVRRNGRTRQTFRVFVGKKAVTLDLFPPRTRQIRSLAKGQWEVDLSPVIPMNWQSGRSLATRLAALERANGICERCHVKPVAHVHHRQRLRRKSLFARVMSDRAQRETAMALCEECHLTVHGGAYAPRKRKGQVG